MQQTTNYNLKKIELTDSPPDITVINPNWDAIDAELKRNAEADAAHKADKAPHIFVGCRVFHSLSQSIANDIDTPLVFDSETYDTDAMHDNITNNSRVTIKTAGKYRVTVIARWENNATGTRQINIAKNNAIVIGVSEVQPVAQTNRFTTQNLTFTHDFNVNDYITVSVRQASGVALNLIRANDYSPVLTVERV